MEIKYFRLIKTIAEEGNMVNSSEKLFLTQSALSHQLRELEHQLGFKVFHRTRNKWLLSEEGVALHGIAVDVLKTIEHGMANIQAIQGGSKGQIKISTECYSFYQGLPRFTQKMGLLYPDIDVEIILDATHRPVPKLISNEIDLALVSRKPLVDGLISVELFEDEVFAVMHRENYLSNQSFLSAQNFQDSHLIIHSHPMDTVYVHEEFLRPSNVTPVKISAVPLTEVALEMVNANMGFACFPKWALKAFRLSEDLIFKKIGPQGLKRTHYITMRESDQNKKYINDFVSNLQEDVLL